MTLACTLTSHRKKEQTLHARYTKLSIRKTLRYQPRPSLRELLRLILQETSFKFYGRDYLQTYGTVMGTKMAVTLANIFMSAVETELSTTAERNHSRGKDTPMTPCSLCGTLIERRSFYFRSKQANHQIRGWNIGEGNKFSWHNDI